jgi:hypothetical protein
MDIVTEVIAMTMAMNMTMLMCMPTKTVTSTTLVRKKVLPSALLSRLVSFFSAE